MKLVELLSRLDAEALQNLSNVHLGAGESESKAAICVNLEGVLRSPKHVRDTIYNLQPPAFRLLEALLDAEGHSLPISGLRERVTEETSALAAQVGSGEVVGRDDGLRLYRRVLTEARRSDLELDPSETALLGVIRREFGIRQVEHFLLEHHPDLQQFWNTDHAFLSVMNLLRTGGLVFALDGRICFPDDLVGLARQILGLEASSAARRRLYERLAGQDTAAVLAALAFKSSGSKEEKLLRLIDGYLQPSEVLDALGIATLKELCRDLGLSVTGAKDELVERIGLHFARNHDIRPEPEAPPPPPPEPRTMTPATFDRLFAALRLQDLSDILSGIGSSRVTGSKEYLAKLIRESRFSEQSLLLELDAKQLEAALARQRLKTAGSKRERVQRLIECFSEPGDAGLVSDATRRNGLGSGDPA